MTPQSYQRFVGPRKPFELAPPQYGDTPDESNQFEDMPDAGMPQSPIGTPPFLSQPPQAPPPLPSQPKAAGQTYGPEEQRLASLIKAGPKRSTLGTIGAAALGGMAGYLNATGRVRVPTPDTKNMVYRAPGGGGWDQALQRQQALAGIEGAAEKSDLEKQKLAGETERWKSQNQRDIEQGAYWKQQAETAAAHERDDAEQRHMGRITQMGGRHPLVKRLPPGEADPIGYSVVPSPYHADPPGTRFAVKADPGQEIDAETAALFHVPVSEDGNYYMQPGGYKAGMQQLTREASDKQKKEKDDAAALEHKREFDARMAETGAAHAATKEAAAGRLSAEKAAQQARQDAQQASVRTTAEQRKDKALVDAQARYDRSPLDPKSRANALQILNQEKQMAQDAYANAVPGASRYKVNADGSTTEVPGAPPPVVGAPPTGGGRGMPPPTVSQAGRSGAAYSEAEVRQRALAANKDPDAAVAAAKLKGILR